MTYLLDTCILSKLRKLSKFPDLKLEDWISKHDSLSFYLSVITLGEVQKGISSLDWNKKEESTKRLILEKWLAEDLLPQFELRILPIDLDVVLMWGRITGTCKKRGFNIPVADGLIAATALVHNMTLITENVDDFIQTGTKLYNPWI